MWYLCMQVLAFISNNVSFLRRFQPCDSFIGYQADTPSAVVFTASRENGMTEDQIEQTWESQVSYFALIFYFYVII